MNSKKKAGAAAVKPVHLALKKGSVFRTVFHINPRSGSQHGFRATHANGQRAEKVILCDADIEPGVTYEVRVRSILRPKADNRGAILVEPLRALTFDLGEDIYVPEILGMKLEALLASGINILLDGPQGSGKTVLARAIAAALGLEYVFFNCSAIFEATDFIATIQVRATAEGGVETVWVPTDIHRAFEAARAAPRRRFLIFLDEFNRCREMARNGIMPALDSTRRIYNPITGRIEPIPTNVLWIAAINNGAQFTGTTTVDPAQLDRFAPLRVDYPPQAEEVRLLRMRFPSLPQSRVETIVRAANAVRTSENLGLDMSMRATEEACVLLSHPNFANMGPECLEDILKDTFCARVPGRVDDDATDAGMMWRVVSDSLKGAKG